MESLWAQNSILPAFKSLEGDVKTEVLIIGGGITGILCAHELHEAGIDYVLAEAKSICGGITKNTTAKITFQHGLIYDKLIREFGAEKAKLYLEANVAAFNKLCGLCKNAGCDFEEKDSFVYSLDDRLKIQNEITALKRLGYEAEFVKELPLPFPVAGAVKFPKQAQFNPLKFLSAVSKDLHIFEHSAVRELKGTTAVTDRGRIFAKKIIVATHFPFINKHGFYFMKMYQQRSYVLALENAAEVGGMYVDEAEGGLSFRNYGNFLLLGGGGHRTGKSGGSFPELREFALKHYPKAAEKCHWAAQDCMTLDGAPYIGKYSAGTENLYVATGFNKWGMTSAMAAAMVLSDLIQGKESPYAEVFSPSRTVFRPQLATNAIEAAAGILNFSARRCPHLGCVLKWNEHEHSWDCPCHGSRFAKNGVLIDNPATGNLKIK